MAHSSSGLAITVNVDSEVDEAALRLDGGGDEDDEGLGDGALGLSSRMRMDPSLANKINV